MPPSQPFPYSGWIELLDGRVTYNTDRYHELAERFSRVPTDSICSVLTMLQRTGPSGHRYFQLNLWLLEGVYYEYLNTCGMDSSIEKQLIEGLRTSYEMEDSVYAAYFHQSLVGQYNYTGNFGLGVMHGRIAREIQEKTGTAPYVDIAFNRYALGHALYHARDYAFAQTVIMEAIRGFPPSDTLSTHYKMNAYNTIGLCCQKRMQFDSAMYYFNQALTIAMALKNDFWQGLICGNIGEVFFLTGRLDTASVLLRRDVDASKASGDFNNAANSLTFLAKIDAMQHHPAAANQKLSLARQWLSGAPNNTFMTNLYEAYAILYKETGQADSLYAYMTRFIHLHDSLELVAANYRNEVVELRMTNQSSVHKILLLNKEKERVLLIRNFIVLTLVFLSIVGYGLLARKQFLLKIKKQQAEEQSRRAIEAADKARHQLEDFTARFREKVRLVEELETQLATKFIQADEAGLISQLSSHTILTDKEWDDFRLLFEKVYPGFFLRLRQQYPDITIGEQRMAALIKLQVTPKEAAGLLGIAPNSVVKTRQRLKLRLGLDPDADLEHYFASKAFPDQVS